MKNLRIIGLMMFLATSSAFLTGMEAEKTEISATVPPSLNTKAATIPDQLKIIADRQSTAQTNTSISPVPQQRLTDIVNERNRNNTSPDTITNTLEQTKLELNSAANPEDIMITPISDWKNTTIWNSFVNAKTTAVKTSIVNNLISNLLSSLSDSNRNLLTPTDIEKIQNDAINNPPVDRSLSTFLKWESTNIIQPIEKMLASNKSAFETTPKQETLKMNTLTMRPDLQSQTQEFNTKNLKSTSPVSPTTMASRQATAQNEALNAIEEALSNEPNGNIFNQKLNSIIKQNETINYLKAQNASTLVELLVSSPRISSDAAPIGKAQVLSAIMSNIADATGLTSLMSKKLNKKDVVNVNNIVFQAQNTIATQVATETASNDSPAVQQSKINSLFNQFTSFCSGLVGRNTNAAQNGLDGIDKGANPMYYNENELEGGQFISNPMITKGSLAQAGSTAMQQSNDNSSFNSNNENQPTNNKRELTPAEKQGLSDIYDAFSIN